MITKSLSLLVGLSLCAAVSVSAQYIETGDAGQTPGTAQATGGTAGVDLFNISGTFNVDSEIDVFDFVDLYTITISVPGSFTATTANDGTTLGLDTILWLFDSTGAPIYANNDEPGGASAQSTLPAGHPSGPLSPGLYYIAVGLNPAVAINSNFQDLFMNPDPGMPSSTDILVPNPAATPAALDNFDTSSVLAGDPSTASYRIDFAAVPEPGSLALVAVGAALLARRVVNRRRR